MEAITWVSLGILLYTVEGPRFIPFPGHGIEPHKLCKALLKT